MAFDFPAAPVLDQTYTAHGVTFRWNSYAWVQVGSTYAPVNNPVFTGDPQGPTPATADNDNSLATTAFVKAQSYITASALSPYAPLASPTLTGDPKAPTPLTADNDTSIATTAFVKAQGYVTGGPYQPLDGDLTALAALAGTNVIYYRSAADTWAAVTISTGLSFSAGTLSCTVSTSGLAPLASPAFTGNPTAPTPTAGDNDTSVATTAFVQGELAAKVAKSGDTMSGALTLPKINVGVVPSTGTEPTNTVAKVSSTGAANLTNPQHVLYNCVAGNNDWGNLLQSYWYDGDGSMGLGIALRQGGVNYEMFRLKRGAAVGAPTGLLDALVPLNLIGPSHWTYQSPGAGSYYSSNTTTDAFFLGTDAVTAAFRLYTAAVGNVFTVDQATGKMSMAGDPVTNLGVATKQYVDNRKAVAHVAISAPAGAEDGALWYETDSGLLYIRYNDGTTTQWVAIAARAEVTP